MRNKQCVNINSPKQSPLEPLTLMPAFDRHFAKKHLGFLLTSLDSVRQNTRYHPEGDVLFHSLQVFQHALKACADPELWAAALLHDVGKAVNSHNHAEIGANKLEGLFSPRIVWLIRHHLHLLIAPRRTRRWLHNTPQLHDLELLRAWDLKGRSPYATVMAPLEAVAILMKHFSVLSPSSDMVYYYENRELG